MILALIFLLAASPVTGKASYYGGEFEGRRTASGERYNQKLFTAAHRTYPFGTLVRVSSGRESCVVRINDRGPFVKGRIIDLSRAAAKSIGLLSAGVANVTIEVVTADKSVPACDDVKFLRGWIPPDALDVKVLHGSLPIGSKGKMTITEAVSERATDTSSWTLSVDRQITFEVIGRHSGPLSEIALDGSSENLVAVSLSW